MKRREFITLLSGAATALPIAGHAQQAAMPVIGFLDVRTADVIPRALAGFRQGLKETGFIESQNVTIEYRWADNQWDRLPALAADLVRRQVTVIVAGGGAPSAVAAKAATSTIPIVVSFGADPVKLGLVANLNRPGGNITGVTFIATELASKRLDLLREIVPQATTIGFLSDARGLTAADQTNNILAAARALGHQVIVVEARSERDFETAFAMLVERKAGALIIAASPLFDNDKLATLAFRHSMPAIYQRREFAEAGGLMSYGASWGDAFRVAGLYVGQILKGAKPSELPFQQSTKLELVINLKTAKALGLAIPQSILLRVDEVIE